MNERVDWQSVLNRETRREDVRESATGAEAITAPLDRLLRRRHAARLWLRLNALALVVLFAAWAGPDTWFVRSPLFRLCGSGASFVLLLLCSVAGLAWWLVVGSNALAAWAWGMLPFGAPGLNQCLIGMVAVVFLGSRALQPLLLRMLGRSERAAALCVLWLRLTCSVIVCGTVATIILRFGPEWTGA